jgi:hypothetical protein
MANSLTLTVERLPIHMNTGAMWWLKIRVHGMATASSANERRFRICGSTKELA